MARALPTPRGRGLSPRIGLIGARRVRQGLGPFVARDLHALGAEVACVLGTSAASAERAVRELRSFGVEASAWHDLDAMLRAGPLDALAILSPPETHESDLRAALDARLHVLCEKPFVWGGSAPADLAAELCAAFEASGLGIVENCQWPCTLPAFARLHPGALEAPCERFEMRLSPASTGERMLVDSISHPLSVLQALAPDRAAGLEALEFAPEGPGALTLRFGWRTAQGLTACEVRLVRSESTPREAGYGVNGLWAERLVRKSDYSMLFAAGDRSVELPDPLRLLLAGFVGGLADDVPQTASPWQIVQRMQMLESIAKAYRGAAH